MLGTALALQDEYGEEAATDESEFDDEEMELADS
jgi:hypothetical protein